MKNMCLRNDCAQIYRAVSSHTAPVMKADPGIYSELITKKLNVMKLE